MRMLSPPCHFFICAGYGSKSRAANISTGLFRPFVGHRRYRTISIDLASAHTLGFGSTAVESMAASNKR
jgi:hypothetical protein